MVKKVNLLNSSSHRHKCAFIITDTINSGNNTEKTFFYKGKDAIFRIYKCLELKIIK